VLDVSGAGITLMAGDTAGPISVSDPHAAVLEEVQFTVGVGPCQDAFRTGMSVHAPRMDDASFRRWPSFVEVARAHRIGGVFAYPLVSTDFNLGVLTLYQQLEGDLSKAQHDDSIRLAEVLTDTVLTLQADAAPGELGAGLEGAVAYRSEIYQASGMVSFQMGISADEALVRLRAYAFAENRPLSDVAADIVHRRLRLADDFDPGV
jgi:hypothetical protein